MAKDLLDEFVTTMRVIHVVEGCKSCKSLWLDESNRLEISRGTIVSNEKGLE